MSGDEDGPRRLLQELNPATLLRLRGHFVERPETGGLVADEGRFVEAVRVELGAEGSDAFRLFALLDREEDGLVAWERLLETREGAGAVGGPIRIEDLDHCKKESISIILTIETKTSFCYVVVSRHGKVGLYDGKFKYLLSYDLFFIRTGISRRVRDVWITAAVYLSDSKSLVITASDKSMMIYDASTLCHVPVYLITGITNVITCLSYNSSTELRSCSYLVIGDDLGGMTTITFKQPRISLFYKKYQDRLNSFFWIELQGAPHENFCKVHFKRRIHSRPVKKIYHIKSNDTIISCSNDPEASVIIRHVKGIRDPYIFNIPRGVACFYYSEALTLLATGGADGYLRLWEPVVTSKASGVFPCQLTRIVDVIILAHLCLVISLNKNAVLRVWEIFEQKCIQTINLLFPSLGVLGKPIQFGFHSIYCGALREQKEQITNIDVEKDEKISEENDIKEIDSNFLKSQYSDKEYMKWNRPEIIVTCCNHIAIVPLNDGRGGEISTFHLPPPEKTHRPRKPSIWDDEPQTSKKNKDQEHLIQSSVDYYSIEDGDDALKLLMSKHPPLEEMMKDIGLSGIWEEDFLARRGLKHDMNKKLGQQKIKQEKMRLPVSLGAPFTALDLHEHKEIKFSLSLPISDRMKMKSGLDFFSDPQDILIHKSCFSMETPKSNYGTSITNKTSDIVDKNKNI